jgi:hypothetical protein
MAPVGQGLVIREHYNRIALDLDLLMLRFDCLAASANLIQNPEVRRLTPFEREPDARVALDSFEACGSLLPV